jgi:hypothetical protein
MVTAIVYHGARAGLSRACFRERLASRWRRRFSGRRAGGLGLVIKVWVKSFVMFGLLRGRTDELE